MCLCHSHEPFTPEHNDSMEADTNACAAHQFNERCWRQNLLSAFHTTLSVIFLITAIATDPGAFSRRLYPHDAIWLSVDLGFSLGYFTFALPMSYHMAFVLKAGFPYGSPVMVLHHMLVVVAQSTFLLTGYPHFYMAASGLLFELTNVFFIPHVLMAQLQIRGLLPTINGVLLVLVYTGGRALCCTALAVLRWVLGATECCETAHRRLPAAACRCLPLPAAACRCLPLPAAACR